METKKTRKMVMIALFVALNVICTRFLSYESPTIRIGVSFIPLSLCAMLYGPLLGGAAAAIADIIGIMLFPKGAFFPGFTLSAFLTGTTYGLFLHDKPKNFIRVGAAVLVIYAVISLGLDTLWIMMMTGKGFIVLLPARLIKAVVMVPIEVATITLLWKHLHSFGAFAEGVKR